SVRAGTVRVADAHGAPPTVPFWLGEAPSRTDELSSQVARLREDVVRDGAAAVEGLGMQEPAVDQLVRYLRASERMLGGVPSTTTIIAERFFDEAGGMQLVIHAPFGGRINRAWGLALRKRFCRTFDFELQAAATDDGIVLSLGEQHSFPLADIFHFVTPGNVEEVLTQAVLQSPLFPTRFRWNAQRALALPRYRNGKKIPPQIQRARAEDLMAAVFPAQVGCQDNHAPADVELPDHPLVKEAMDNCLREAMDVDGLKQVLQGIREGRIRTLAVDLPEPSPLSHQLLNSAPYTYLDDAPLEERRARAVALRRTLPAEDAASFGALDAAAIEQVVADAQPLLRDPDELHDTMLQLVLFPEAAASPEHAGSLISQRRAAGLEVGGRRFLVPAERVQHARALFPEVPLAPPLEPLPGDGPVAREVAALAVVRGRVEIDGPTTTRELAEKLGLGTGEVEGALAALEAQGQVLRGMFRPEDRQPEGTELEWCDRRLLQRIHRLTVGRLRREVEPLSAQDYMRFLFRWHHFDDPLRGTGGLLKAVTLLQGYEAPAAAWEVFLLPQRMKQYFPELLEKACFNGEVAWGRLSLRARVGGPQAPGPRRGVPAVEVEPNAPPSRGVSPNRNASITFVRREELDWMLAAARPGVVLSDGGLALPEDLSHAARDVAQVLERRGASFFADLVGGSRRLQSEVEDALWELLAHGLVTADALENLRVLQSPKRRKRQKLLRRGGPGRWSLLVPSEQRSGEEIHERTAKLFLQRYGIVWRDLVLREPLSPSWRELLFIYRRMEARGEIRGGRFLSSFAGEQFALPEAVDMARAVRRAPLAGTTVHLAAVDPLNLTGIATPGPRVPAVMGNFITYVDGAPVQGVPTPAGLRPTEAS
ncbi:MAG TPA: DEAD/DEAH box helicase, partial [Myxococcales bacterium]|nr:DEAD/DEAH box helicase [Myxococcales bacterium]